MNAARLAIREPNPRHLIVDNRLRRRPASVTGGDQFERSYAIDPIGRLIAITLWSALGHLASSAPSGVLHRRDNTPRCHFNRLPQRVVRQVRVDFSGTRLPVTEYFPGDV